jgi:thiosulfate/3-mercaptopyruvate sulfurtransferase
MPDLAGKWLVETEWLSKHLDAPDLAIVDGSWHLPTMRRDARKEYLEEHIPGAVFFDIDAISDRESDLPHMLPSPLAFSSAMQDLGIGDGMRIVVYDNSGIYSAPRVWWTFRAMGVNDVAVLNGGLPKWKADGHPVETGPAHVRQASHFSARLNRELLRDAEDMQALLSSKAAQIVDARSAERFSGEAPEPRAGLRSGHIPGSLNLPYDRLINNDGTLKSADEIVAAFKAANVDLEQPVATTCGSGVTASTLALALAVIGHVHTSVYDGSWSEWGANEDLPITTGV